MVFRFVHISSSSLKLHSSSETNSTSLINHVVSMESRNCLSSPFSSSLLSNNKTQEPSITYINVTGSSVGYTDNFFHDFSLVSKVLTEDNMGRYYHIVKEVGEKLFKTTNLFECLIEIDALQHLAIDHHFLNEIEPVLSRLYESLLDTTGVVSFASHYGLYDISLCFRLLRENGYKVPTDVFNRFMEGDGEFKQTISNDLRGMMGLYEASQLGMEGEDVLDQANAFTVRHLNDSIALLDQDAARHIRYVLDNPHHKSLATFGMKHYIKHFEQLYGKHHTFQELAKADFNMVQSLHQREIEEIRMWWRDLGLAQELKFARNQPIKWYMWSVAVLPDPKLSYQRIELTKPISLVYVLDDIFDVYGTIDELVLLTEAINKWDFNAVEKLPYCMKIFCKVLHDTTEEISSKVFKEHGWNPFDSLRKAWIGLCNAFLVEAKWLSSGQVPDSEEYLKNAVVTSGVPVVLIHLFVLLGEGIDKVNVDRVESFPGIISSPATILRLWDDLGSAKDENQEGYDGSYIDCYMKEHEDSTIESAREHVMHMISSEWKKLNKECLTPYPFPAAWRKASLNCARMVQLMYTYDENQRTPFLEERVRSMLYESIPVDT